MMHLKMLMFNIILYGSPKNGIDFLLAFPAAHSRKRKGKLQTYNFSALMELQCSPVVRQEMLTYTTSAQIDGL